MFFFIVLAPDRVLVSFCVKIQIFINVHVALQFYPLSGAIIDGVITE